MVKGREMDFLKPRYRFLVGIWIGVLFGTVIYFNSKGTIVKGMIFPVKSDFNGAGLLDGCYHIYLDVGSNVGIQGKYFYLY